MVARKSVGRSEGERLVDEIKRIRKGLDKGLTSPPGVKFLDDDEDIVWNDFRPGGSGVVERSVKRFAVELDSTAERAAALEKRLADSEGELDAARDALANLRDKELPALKEQLENVGDVDFSEFDAKIAAAEAKIAATEQAWKDAVADEKQAREAGDAEAREALDDGLADQFATLDGAIDAAKGEAEAALGSVKSELAATDEALSDRIDGVFRNMTVTDTSYLSNAVVGSLAARIAKVIELEASRITAGKIGAGQINVVELAGEVARFITLDASRLRITDKADIDEAVVQALAARTADIQEAFIQNLRTNGAAIDEAVIGDLAANIITSGLFRTAKEGQRIEIDSNGIRSYGLDDNGEDSELINIGRDGTASIDTGSASIDAKGGVTGIEGRFQKLWIGGREFEDVDAILDGPRGVVAWGRRVNPTNWRKSLTRVIELWPTLKPGRLYRISTSPARVDTKGVGGKHIWARLEWWQAPWTSWDKVWRLNDLCFTSTQWEGHMPGLSAVFATGPSGMNLTEPTEFGFLVRTECPGAFHRLVASDSARFDMVVEDIGPDIDQSGVFREDASEESSTPAPAPPPVVPKQRRHLSKKASWCATYYRGGGRQSGKADAIQGYYPGVGYREGIWLFAGMPGDLSGSRVEKVRLGFWVAHTYSSTGGVAHFHLHGRSAFGSDAGLGKYLGSKRVKRNSWVTYDITDPAICAGFANGTYKGFGISTNDSSRDAYIRGNPDATLEIDYWK